MRRPYGVKGSVYVVTLPAFQRCLKDGPDAAERRPGSGFPTGGGTGDGHLEAHHDLQATPARPDLCSRKLYRQQQTRFDPGLHFHYFFHNEGTAPASVDVVERPPESKIELLLLSPRETLRYLNRLKESEEAATLPAHGEASSFWSTSSALNAPQSESKRIGQGDVRDET
ncbi:hypothetical protein L3X38_000182 (mitochondrion) [Prunus dulcis]|uniref:Uncharacterized protein n=1 Tax=Prunus dulcis TaxID=3755 RepID=A0AAD4USS9_PRUDU|nr:hypothetical protein L3X38_000182 [Prunus dulcis]